MHARLLPFLLLPLAGLACTATATDDGDADEGANAIENGTVDRTSIAVGMLDAGETFKCTGALIAPNIVLTSAHCFEAPVPTRFRLAAYAGSGDFFATIPYAIVDSRVAPGALAEGGICPKTNPDVALVKLEKPVVGVTPLTVSFSAPRIGATCTVIGFGAYFDANGALSAGIRRTATEKVVENLSASIRLSYLTGQSNRGDSGGPLVCDGAIVGTSSCAPKDGDGHTLRGQDYYSRLEAAYTFVDATMRAWGAR